MLIARGHELAGGDDDRSRRATVRIRDWMLQARRMNFRWGNGDPWSQRCLTVNQAALALAFDLDEEDPNDHRSVLAACWQHALGEPFPATWLPGACLARLPIDQAQHLADVAAAFAAGDPEVSAHLVEIITGSNS